MKSNRIEYCKSNGVLFPITENITKAPTKVSFREAQELVIFQNIVGKLYSKRERLGKKFIS